MTTQFGYRACLLALLPLLPGAAWAARDCNFGGNGAIVHLTTGYTALTVEGKVSGATPLAKDVLMNTDSDIVSHCQAGNDGQNLNAETNTSVYKWHEPGALFPTNIPGIFYNVHLKLTGVADGYLPNSSIFTRVADISDSKDDEGGPMDGAKWKVYIDFYQDETYTGNHGQSKVHPREDMRLGSYRLGGDAHAAVPIYIYANSFGMDISTPTCTSAVTSVSNNTVDFGDINIGDAAGGRVPEKPFSITLSGCSLLNGVTTRLTTEFVNGGGNMIANGLTGQNVAAGVGMQIRDGTSNTLRPNDANSTAKMTNLAMPGTVKLDFTAQLREDGNPVKPGAFQAIGTFNITYQ